MKSTFVRRLSAWMMAAVMLLSMVPAMAAFRDTAGHWAEKTLTEWQDKGLIDGYGDGSFQPDGTMTRAEFAKLVNRTLGFTAESAISFSDVTERDWFYAEVARAVAAGYAQGSGGAFRPNQAVTRAEAAVMLARALDLAANEERANAFADAASIPAWARGSVAAVAESGYMNGYPDGTFGAGGTITRAEAVVTLDRVLKSAKETVIEAAGTTLENETIPGDLVIAESVGNGNVTLKNVTVLGSVIVKGGGANSIYFDGVRVGGAVRLQKENVHLRLMGDTALERVEVGLPCRVTQGSTFKGSLGTLVIDLEKTSNQKIQIEVPAKLVELLSRANVALHADVETLQIDKDAEGAQLDIRRGVTVGELSIDARVALTGSGLVVSLVVSVSGVTVSSTLTVKKTETEGGAKAPTTSGSSSGGSYTPVKRVTGAAAAPDVTVPHGTSEADAMSRFPASVTLNVTENGKAGTVSAAVSWALDKAYDEDPRMDTVYTVTGTVTIPDGYTYDGTLTVTASLTVTTDPENVVVGILEVAGLELPYGAQESDVQLPAQVTVKIKNGHTERADVRWTLDGEWTSPGVNTFMGTVSMPPFQYYNGEMNADIKTTVTVVADGATPKTKAVVDNVPLALTSIGYMRAETLVLEAARQRLPADVLLQCEDKSYIEVVVSPDDWKFTLTPYVPTPGKNQTVSFTEDTALPAGYAYAGGTSPVRCYVEVKALDTAALDGALDEAQAQLAALTDSEADALADPAKLYVAPNGTSAGNVTNGARFIYADQKTALNDAYTAARSKQNSGTFASQAECDSLTRDLQAQSAALKVAVQTGTNKTTSAYLLRAVQTELLSTEKGWYAYNPGQLLKKGSAYPLYIGPWTVDDTTVEIVWEAQGAGARYVEIKSENDTIGYYEWDGIRYGTSHGALITDAPDEPKEVRFVATVKDYDGTVIGKLGTNGEYTATIGAPIRVDTTAPAADPPRLTSGNKKNNISVQVPLTGAEYITGVDTSRITAAENTAPTGEVPLATSAVSITAGKSCTVDSSYGLSVPVTASCGFMGVTLAPTSPVDPDADPAYKIGNIPVTIQKGALTVDESGGWYAPDEDLTYGAVVWGCNPTVTVLTQPAEGPHYTVSVNMAYMFEIGAIEVVYKTSDGIPSGAGDGVHVIFSRDDGETDASVQDGIAYKGKNVTLTPGAYHIWVMDEKDGTWLQGDTLTVNDNSSSAGSTP